MSRKLKNIGEQALIQRIVHLCSPVSKYRSPSLKALTENGDDAFVAKLASDGALVFSTDTMVEGTHFNPGWIKRYLSEKEAWKAIGHKIMAVNLSDLASMGNVDPILALVTIGLNGDISVDSVDNLYTGMLNLAKKQCFEIAGGDVIRADKSIVSVTIVGRMSSGRILRRSGAATGDVLMVSGPIGLSSAGLKILKNRVKWDRSLVRTLLEWHLFPMPCIQAGKILASEAIMATSCMDLSDDLVSSLEILGKKSRVGFEVELGNVPVAGPLREFCRRNRSDPMEHILYGGEDYQLLFTVKPARVGRVIQKIPGAFVLGSVRDARHGIQFKKNSVPVRMRDSRFRHF